MPITLPPFIPRVTDHTLECERCGGARDTLPDTIPIHRCTVNGDETVLCVRCCAKRAVSEMLCRVRVRTG